MVDADKIAKLRAKAMSTGYPEEAKAFERKAHELMAAHGVSEDAVQRALNAIFGGRSDTPSGPTPGRPAERGSMIEAVIWLFEEEDNRAMRAREIWTLIEARGLYTSAGRTPWATVASKLSTDPIFERVRPGLYRLRR
jgi:hypothetical protein